MTLAAPAAPAGVVAVMEVSPATWKAVAAAPPIVTLVAPVNPEPLIVTAVPPTAGPLDGLIEEILPDGRFRVALENGHRIIEQLLTTGSKRFAVFYQNDAYGQAGLNGTKAAVGKRGGDIVDLVGDVVHALAALGEEAADGRVVVERRDDIAGLTTAAATGALVGSAFAGAAGAASPPHAAKNSAPAPIATTRPRAARMSPAARREQLLQAALTLCARRGLGSARHTDLAEVAGVPAGIGGVGVGREEAEREHGRGLGGAAAEEAEEGETEVPDQAERHHRDGERRTGRSRHCVLRHHLKIQAHRSRSSRHG